MNILSSLPTEIDHCICYVAIMGLIHYGAIQCLSWYNSTEICFYTSVWLVQYSSEAGPVFPQGLQKHEHLYIFISSSLLQNQLTYV